MNFLTDYNNAVQILIVAAMVVGSSVVITTGFALVFPKLSKKKIATIYAFSAGFILPLALLGLLGGAIGHLSEHFGIEHGSSGSALDYFLMVVIIVAGGLLGAGTYLLVRHFIIRKAKNIHQDHAKHGHTDEAVNLTDLDHPKTKWTAIFLILLHRIPAGLSLGIALYALNIDGEEALGTGIVVAFIVHVIPEALIVYYRQIDMGYTKVQALLFAIGVKFLLVPFMFVGFYGAEALESQYWVMPLILAAAGVIMSMTAVAELLPGLIHEKLSSKDWYATFTAIAVGLIVSGAILIFHHH